MNSKCWHIALLCYCIFQLSCSPSLSSKKSNWCDREIRPELTKLDAVDSSSEWFKVYNVGESVFAIAEPYNFQEVISYLILGSEKALLFDTGMGLDSMSILISELTDLPVTVINSHTHYDHIGSNHEFDNILAMNTDYTKKWATHGWPHESVKHEIQSDALCSHYLSGADIAEYHISPFKISKYVHDGYIIELGNRQIEVISIPGHTPDAIALLDRERGYLWTGDTFYEATIWLFFEGTDLEAYEKSVNKLADIAPLLTKVFPAHNTAVSNPERLDELQAAFQEIVRGEKSAKQATKSDHPEDDNALVYEFEHFSFLIGKEHMSDAFYNFPKAN